MIRDFEKALNKLTSSMPEHVRRQWAERERQQKDLMETLRTNCYDALEDITTAMRHPRISQTYLRERHCQAGCCFGLREGVGVLDHLYDEQQNFIGETAWKGNTAARKKP